MKNKDALLIEYQIAHHEVDRLNKQIWATAQIIIPFSLTTFGVVGIMSTPTINSIFYILMTGLISIIVVYGWYLISKRFLAYQSIAQFRLLEIEKELNLWCTHYELIRDNNSTLGKNLYSKKELNEVIKKNKNIAHSIKPNSLKTLKILKRFFLLITASWIVLFLKEIILYLI